MTMKKKILSAVLALCLAFGSAAALPQSAFVESTSITASAESTATSGKCGDNVSWTLKDGVLTISGKGKMNDYSGDSPFAYRTDIKSVVIKSGVTSIGENVFEYCESITSITIPNSIKSIGLQAFLRCTSLKSITLPSSVTNIGNSVFWGCSSLTSVTIPSSVKSISEGMFVKCESLKSITIPSSVTSIGENGFADCTGLTSITIPKSVTSLGKSTFSGCSNLATITIPSSVTSIGVNAFSSTKWIENQHKKNPLVIVNGILIDGTKCNGKITIPSNVKSINESAFSGCESLTSVTIPSSVTIIYDRAFWECKKLAKVTIPNSVKSIGTQAFIGCTSLKSLTIPNGVTSIGNDAFSGCTSLTTITIPKSVTSIGGYAFSGTKWLENQQKKSPFVVVNGILIDGMKCTGKVTIPSSVKTIGEMAFYGNTNITSVSIPNGVTSIDGLAFAYCSNIKSITIPNSTTNIGAWAFKWAAITSITIPSSVKTIGDSAFEACSYLKSVTIQKGVKRIEGHAFWFCSNLNSVTIPDSVTSIGDGAFASCSKLKSITIPKSVTSIGESAVGYGVDGKVSGFTIYGYKGSAAEKYAKDNGFKFVARSTTEPKTVRFAGSDRAETATLISNANKGGMYKTADTVVIATGFDFHDALAAVPLASAYNAPLLLADRDNLSAKTLAEIKRLKAKNVIVVASTNSKDQNGKDAAIRNNVYKQLKGYKVTKLVGSSYYETAKNVAKNLKTKTGKNPTSVFITTDKNYADALSASPVAAILGAPILYVKSTGALNSNTTAYLKSIKSSVKNIYIVGGVNAVSKDVVAKIKTVLPNKKVTRFDGTDRYETCIKINKTFASTLSGKAVCVAKGYNFPDALAGGVFAAKQKAPLFLADALGAKATISKTQDNYLYIKNPSKLYIFGGETAVPTALVKTIAKASV